MTEKRQIGYIYSIRSYQTDLIYIGSTFSPLHKRIYQHRKSYNQFHRCPSQKYLTSFEILKYEDNYIELIETYENVNKTELLKHEGQQIRNSHCVNKFIAGRTQKQYDLEHKDAKKLYKDRNKEKIKEYHKDYQKQYYEQNNELIKEKRRQYDLEHKDAKRLYKDRNKEKINEYHKDYQKQYYE